VNKQLTPDEFIALVDKHRDEYYRYVHRILWDSGMADDVFSAAVLAAYENRSKFTPGTNFRAWMYRIITNKCYVANRETSRAFQPLDELGPDIASVAADAGYRDVLDEPEHFLEQCGDEVQAAFRRLSTAERSCLMLRAIERFSYKEIAETLDMPVGTVMTHLSRGRAKLRSDLLAYGKERGLVREFPRLMEREDTISEDDEGLAVS
jgi:RNA polymerase sigma-70 factor (ECF subfamily)